MTTARWARTKELFHAALALDPASRGPFLADACGGDAALRQEIESLLASHGAAEDFLSRGALDVTAAALAARGGEHALSPGTRLGPYEVTGLLGAGGMGEVYRARDERLGRDVAVKVLPAAVAGDPERLVRFEQEARAASALNHPHIVAVYDVGRHDGLPYLVTELLLGHTLAERIAQGPVPLKRALEWAAQAARGLAAAHERGIVHRDVKPANLFVTGDGVLKILDFGLAKLAPQQPDASAARPLTSPGVPMGTAGYMSPELVRGEATDHRTDQFSLGCVIYEMLAGVGPFARPTAAQSMAAVLVDEPRPLAHANPRVPNQVAWLADRCLAKDPDDRYASTRDLARDAELALGRSSMPSAPRLATVRRLPAPLRTLAAVVLAAGAAYLWARGTAAAPVPTLRYLTYSGHDFSPAASPDARTIAFTSTRDGKRRIWLKQIATGSEVPLTSGEDDHARFSPDGTEILFARRHEGRSSLHRISSIGGEPRRAIDNAMYGDFSPDGTKVAFVRQVAGAVVLATARPDGSDERALVRLDAAQFTGNPFAYPRWSPDGRSILATQGTVALGEPTFLALVDAVTGEQRRVPAPGDAGVWPGGLAWVGDRHVLCAQPGSVVAMQSGSSARLTRLDLRSGASRAVLSASVNVVDVEVLGPGRALLGTRWLRQNLRELPLGASTPGARWLSYGNAADRQPAYSPDGEWVAFSSNRSGNLDLWAVSRRTGAVRRLTDHAAHDWDPHFMPDGRLLWSTNRSGSFEVWIAEADGSGARQVTRDGVHAENPVASPDGAWIVYASANPATRGIVKVRPDGSQAALLTAGNRIEPEVSPDGRYVSFVADPASDRPRISVVRLADGAPAPFEIALPAWVPGSNIDEGRSRWLADGRGLAFIERAPDGTYAVSVQEFLPGGDTTAGRRRVAGLEAGIDAESFGLSPDGASITVSFREQLFDLMLAEDVPGVLRPAAGR